MANDPVTVERRDDITVVALALPEKRNALTMDLRRVLLDKLDEVMADATTRAVVLTGAGGHFCAGGDLKSMQASEPLKARHRMMAVHRIVRLLAEGPKPVVSAVEGVAFGGGMALAALADCCVAARDARFGAVFGKVGLAPDMGFLWAVPARIGLARTRRLAMMSEVLTGEQGAELGLVDVLAEPGQALDTALGEARRYAAAAPVSLAATKMALACLPGSLDAALADEVNQQSALMQTADHREAREAFFDKRDPVFRGQ